MDSENKILKSICPVCGKEFSERPALSRKDNVSYICPDCGTREALESIGIDGELQDEIIDTIHKNIGS